MSLLGLLLVPQRRTSSLLGLRVTHSWVLSLVVVLLWGLLRARDHHPTINSYFGTKFQLVLPLALSLFARAQKKESTREETPAESKVFVVK